jgi:hypothetical protein
MLKKTARVAEIIHKKIADITQIKPDVFLSATNKYRIVGELLGEVPGALLDVGSRDRKLKEYVHSHNYFSADIVPGDHDYVIDLERALPFEDLKFNTVVALDVLEHLEHIHKAMKELLRISADRVVVALPNLASYRHRISYLLRGRMQTDKYELRPEHQRDRHRWLVTMPDADKFIAHQATENGFKMTSICYQIAGRNLLTKSLWDYLIEIGGLYCPALLERGIYLLSRSSQHEGRIKPS